jgi:3-oxoacyl-(acyl-carrier-protein) synthase
MMAVAGTFHCIVSALCIEKRKIPPCKNLKNPIRPNGKVLNYVREVVDKEVKYVVMNNVGFGGVNNSMVIGKYQE